MPRPPQSYASYRRWFALYHFFVMPILLTNLVVRGLEAIRTPTLERLRDTVVALALVGGMVAARTMALILQNGLVGLEMRLRLSATLPAELRPRIPELRLRQLIGLRFASDAELPALVARGLVGELRTADQIKRQVVNWRPD